MSLGLNTRVRTQRVDMQTTPQPEGQREGGKTGKREGESEGGDVGRKGGRECE